VSEPVVWTTRDEVSRGLRQLADLFAATGTHSEHERLCRVAAGLVLEPAAGVSARSDAPGCRGCGVALPPQPVGRPRLWCGGRGRCAKSRAKSRGATIAA
jgi:hypothetical protein